MQSANGMNIVDHCRVSMYQKVTSSFGSVLISNIHFIQDDKEVTKRLSMY